MSVATSRSTRAGLSGTPTASVGAEPVGVPVGLQLAAVHGTDDSYLVTAIDAGTGNGWHFSAAVLAASVQHWQRLNVYLGHAEQDRRGPNGERQPADLAGVFAGGFWGADRQAIRGRLRLMGPGAAMARAVARAYLDAYEAGEPAPDVGLSASLYLVAAGKHVVEISKVESLDVIATTPARGGRFEAAPGAPVPVAAGIPAAQPPARGTARLERGDGPARAAGAADRPAHAGAGRAAG